MKNQMDRDKIKQGVRLILEGIGEDPQREGLRETPDRIARMYEEIFGGLTESAEPHLGRTFPIADGNVPEGGCVSCGMVLEKDITVYSTCEHHLMPFYGKVHIAYLPRERVAGLSKLARTVEVFARRPQLQERLTAQIAGALMEYLNPRGVMVIIEAEHMCMTMRGVKKPGTKTMTYACLGEFQENERLAERVFQAVGL